MKFDHVSCMFSVWVADAIASTMLMRLPAREHSVEEVCNIFVRVRQCFKFQRGMRSVHQEIRAEDVEYEPKSETNDVKGVDSIGP